MDPEQRAILLRLIEQENETPDQRVKRADKSVKFPSMTLVRYRFDAAPFQPSISRKKPFWVVFCRKG